LKQIMNNQDELYLDRYLPTAQIYEVHTRVQNTMLEFEKIKTEGYSQKARSAVEYDRELIDENIAAYEKSRMFSDEATLFARVKDGIRRYYSISDAVIVQGMSGKPVSADDMKKLDDAAAVLMADIDKIVSMNIEYSRTLDINTDRSANTIFAVFIVLTVLISAVLIIPSIIVIENFSRAVRMMNNYCKEVAGGNLTAHITDRMLHSQNELGIMAKSVHSMVTSISKTVSKIRDISNEVASSSEEMSDAATSFSDNAQNQSASTEQVTATVEEVSAGMEGIAHNALAQFEYLNTFMVKMNVMTANLEEMNERLISAQSVSGDIAQRAQAGGESLAKMTDSMQRITSSSTEMTAIAGIINDISDQINLLSLNAAIEAARAGDAGRGFAVVADEISKLADGTASSIKDIDRLIRSNNSEIQSGQDNIAQTIESISTIITGVNEIGGMMDQLSAIMMKNVDEHHEVNQAAASMKERSNEIKNATDEQKTAMNEIVRSVASINELTQTNAAGAEEISGTSESLAAMADGLISAVEYFKV